MAIADQLVSINNSKLEIKAAIETKGVTVGTVPLADYAEKILAITTGSIAPVPETWVRPADWLAMPTVTSTQQVVYVLMAVNNAAYNLLALACAGAYTVDWGDGVVENFATGVQANHNFDWAAVSAGTLTSKGYRQALVTITPQAGQNLTSVDLSRKHTLRPSFQSTNSLDVLMSGPNLASVQVSTTPATLANAVHPILERIQIPYCAVNCVTNTANAFSCYSLRVWSANNNFLITQSAAFAECNSIQELPAIRTSGVIQIFQNCYKLIKVGTITVVNNVNFGLTGMFGGCYDLFECPVITVIGTGKINSTSSMFTNCRSLSSVSNLSTLDTSALTSTASMFSGCSYLPTVPLFNTALVTNMSSMFLGCSSLTSIPSFNFSAVTLMDSMFRACSLLTSVPSITTTALTTVASMFQDCTALTSAPALNLPVCTTTASMFNGCTNLRIAPTITTSSSLTTTLSMFTGCIALESVGLFTTSSVNIATTMFNGCKSLTSIPAFNFAAVTTGNGNFITSTVSAAAQNLNRSQVTGLKFTHSYINANLSAAELNAIYTNLGTATAQTITVTGNPGIVTDDPTIATAKGWTVTG